VAASLLSAGEEDDQKTPRWYLRSSSYVKNIRIMAWVRRFQKNSKPGASKKAGGQSVEEFQEAEYIMSKFVQQQTLPKKCDIFGGLVIVKADDGLYEPMSVKSGQVDFLTLLS
jgi:hypothetical protein